MVEVPLIPSDSGNELALFRNIAIIAQSFWAARYAPVMPERGFLISSPPTS